MTDTKKAAPRQECSPKNTRSEYTTASPRKLYHYTTGQKLPQILESGYLKPSAAGGAPDELPLLWLSTAKDIEPTSLKMVQAPDGGLYGLTREQQRELAGNVRFVLKSDLDLLSWRDACKAAGIGSRERKALERSGRDLGGKPSHWYATPDALPVDLFDVEVDTGRRWVPLEDAVVEVQR